MTSEELKRELIAFRHDLHRHPEAAFEEKRTSGLVAEKLRGMGLDVAVGIGGTGVVATLKAGDGDRIIGLRADMDSLKLDDAGAHDHVSQTPGRLHGCGHDGHTTMLLGAAKLLSESRDFNGTVRFVFQPAEEPGKGAQAMIKDGLFERFPMDEMYGLHNSPSTRFGTIGTRVGGIMASEDNFTIKITGRGGHASAPENLVDPLAAASTIYLALQTIVSRNASPAHAVVVSVTEFETDGGHNAIPSYVEMRGDTRSYTTEDSALIESRMRAICENACAMYGAKCEVIYTHEFYPTINTAECTAVAVRAARAALGAENVDENMPPRLASEDFAQFLNYVPGNYVWMGTAETEDISAVPQLHNAHYDFNDNILMTGVEYWVKLVKERLA